MKLEHNETITSSVYETIDFLIYKERRRWKYLFLDKKKFLYDLRGEDFLQVSGENSILNLHSLWY